MVHHPPTQEDEDRTIVSVEMLADQLSEKALELQSLVRQLKASREARRRELAGETLRG